MPRPPNVSPLPEPERREALAQYLDVLDRDSDLAHFRSQVPAGPGRQLALFAALERAAFRGNGAVCPPPIDDVADQLLCDILEACDREPLKNQGAYYGPHRHRVNLQALGVWSGKPQALELFTTAFSHLNAAEPTSCPSSTLNCSPAPQESASFGELIACESGEKPANSDESGGILHHAGGRAGEECGTSELLIPARPVRRGRPPAVDDVAKGRLLGLMAFGLSFRQAAAQLGVHHVTLLNLLKRDEQFAQQVAEARLDAISQPLVTVVQASRTNWRAAAWLAKYLDGRRASSYEVTPEEREVKRVRQ